jgi:hypothetical protein
MTIADPATVATEPWLPPFVREGAAYAVPVDTDYAERIRIERNILAFVACWEALQDPELDIPDRLAAELFGRMPELELDTRYLNRLANF